MFSKRIFDVPEQTIGSLEFGLEFRGGSILRKAPLRVLVGTTATAGLGGNVPLDVEKREASVAG